MQKCHFRGNDDNHGYQTFTLCVSNEVTSHELGVSELTYFSRSLRSEFVISLPGGTFCYYLTETAVIWCNDVYTAITYYARAKFSPIRFLMWPPGALLKNADG